MESLIRDGHLTSLVHPGARIHQAGCNGCIRMGQAPATGQLSLRTVPRNLPGRSGTLEDKVCLVSLETETATASALSGVITDPRTLKMEYPIVCDPEKPIINLQMFSPPLSTEKSKNVKLIKGPNIAKIPELAPVDAEMILPVLLKVGDNISTDAIYAHIAIDDLFEFNNLPALTEKSEFSIENKTKNKTYRVAHQLSLRQLQILFQGGQINWRGKKT